MACSEKTVEIFEFDDRTQEKKNCERRVPPTCVRAQLIKQRAERFDSFIFKFNIASSFLSASIFFPSLFFTLSLSVLIHLHIHNLRINVLHKSFLSCLFVSPMELSFPFNASPDINTSV